MQIFLSFNSKELALAKALRCRLRKINSSADVFFSPVSLGAGFWVPKLAAELAGADAFLLLIGEKGIGPWQELEYYNALDRHVADNRFTLVPLLVAPGQAPGLPFLRTLNWVETRGVGEDADLHKLIAALKGETIATTTPLWRLVNPYRGLEAMTEANADYFYGRSAETIKVLRAFADHPGRYPMLVGGSGVGKSSVAQAGVLSALKSMRWPGRDEKAPWPAGLANSRSWVHLVMRPGETPVAALAATVTRLWRLDPTQPEQAALPRKWANGLMRGDNKLADLIDATQEQLRMHEGGAPGRILLYVDQGEELYTRAAPEEARQFSIVLAEALRDSRFVAFTSLRADHFDKVQFDEVYSNAVSTSMCRRSTAPSSRKW